VLPWKDIFKYSILLSPAFTLLHMDIPLGMLQLGSFFTGEQPQSHYFTVASVMPEKGTGGQNDCELTSDMGE
jgi:hypothetical protein